MEAYEAQKFFCVIEGVENVHLYLTLGKLSTCLFIY